MTERYVELHAASAFSFLEGASQPEGLIERAAVLEMPAIALLDRNGVYATLTGREAVVKMQAAFTTLYQQQRDDATNEDPLYLAIQLLIGSDNHKGAFTASSLLNALGRVIDMYTPHQAEIKQWNARKLGQQINSQKTILTEKFGMTVERDGHSNGNLYRFEPTLEARENCVRHRTQIDGSLAIMPRQGWGDEDEEASA